VNWDRDVLSHKQETYLVYMVVSEQLFDSVVKLLRNLGGVRTAFIRGPRLRQSGMWRGSGR